MASNFSIERPYVLALLPASLDESGCRYVAAGVYGHRDSKQRRRPEVSVGIDGESASIYEIASKRLLISYPIPPTATFTCPPCSVRYRSSAKTNVARHTYISTQEPTRKITLFKDTVLASGATTSTTVSTTVPPHEEVVYLTTTSVPASHDDPEGHSTGSHLIAVKYDGSISCLDGISLEEKWQVGPERISPDGTSNLGLRILFAERSTAADAINGIFSGQDDAFHLLPGSTGSDVNEMDILVLVSTTLGTPASRYLHILAILPGVPGLTKSQRIVQVHTAPFPSGRSQPTVQRLDLAAGSYCELLGDEFVTYDLSGGIPSLESRTQLPEVTSFLRLSDTAILTSSAASFDVYNPRFRSLQATTPLKIPGGGEDGASVEQNRNVPTLVSYFSRLEVAVAIVGSELVAVQLEPPKTRSRKRRADGLLIDSIGRGASNPAMEALRPTLASTRSSRSAFSSQIPGSASVEYRSQSLQDEEKLDEFLASGDIAAFEGLLAGRFGVPIEDGQPLPNGTDHNGTEGSNDGGGPSHPEETGLSTWDFPDSRALYPGVDRRWVIYALSRLFSWEAEEGASPSGPRLACRMSEANVVNYLVDAGHLSTANFRSAHKVALRGTPDADLVLGQQIPAMLIQDDPTMELLVQWLNATPLGAIELVATIGLIMKSLEVIQDPNQEEQKLLTFHSQDSAAESENGMQLDPAPTADNEDFGMELDRLEEQLDLTSYLLRDEHGTRGRALSIACAKLAGCPSTSVIQSLRKVFRREETMAFISVLRSDLVKNGWTTRYVDANRPDEFEHDQGLPSDGSIALVADLLCRCIDAIGPAGWFVDDAVPETGTGESLDLPDVLSGLMLEVSAALSGLHECNQVRGTLHEMVRYGTSLQKLEDGRAGKTKEVSQVQPAKVRGSEHASRMLPLGLRGSLRQEGVSTTKVVSGGGIMKRSRREFGHLTSQKIGPYTLERIVL